MSDEKTIQQRLSLLRRELKNSRVPALLISSPENRRYFSGFEARDCQINESSGVLMLTARGQWLLTDSRYTEAAGQEAPLFNILTYSKGLPSELGRHQALKKVGCLAYEPEFISVAVLSRIKEALPHLELVPAPFSIDSFRAVKSPEELRLIRKALDITEQAVAALWNRLEPGQTESEAAFFLETEFRRLGAEGPSFDSIVASGPNGALPHAVPGGKKIKNGETVIIDCGARYKGYAADITRTKILGTPKPWQREIYRIVKEAQSLAIAAVKAGVPARDVDQVARDHIAKCGYGPFFGHGLGHGVGLAIHEAPSLSPRNERPLAAGEIITVEPGIYLPGRGGVRLEQLIMVTDKGARVLNRNQDFYDF